MIRARVSQFSIAASALCMLTSCAPPPPPPRVVSAPVAPTPVAAAPAPLPEVHWLPESSDAESLTIAGSLDGGADSVDAVVVSVSCPTAKLGRGEVVADRVSLLLDASEIATALQCHGLRVTATRGKQSTTAVVAFELQMNLPPNVSGGIGVSRTTKSPELVLSIPGTLATARLALGRDSYATRGVVGNNVEFAVPILALTRAALVHQHAIATTGMKPIEYVPEIAVGGQTLPAPAEPAPPTH